MIFTEKKKTIRVMFVPFHDGLQSVLGGKVRLKDILPAMKVSVQAGIDHFAFGGGARFQTPYFDLNEDPFDDMKTMRETVGPDVTLQILTRSVSGVTLTAQSIESLELQAKLMGAHGANWDRNFDYMNDVRNLTNTAKPIVEAGMHHQVCITLMGLPFHLDKAHTADFYIDIGKRLLDSGLHIDSICLKDSSGTTDPKTFYDTAAGLKKIMPPEMLLWQSTHDTASTAAACYMAGIAGGVDGIDCSVRPFASGAAQPDVRSMAYALKGTGYSLNVDHTKMPMIEDALGQITRDYAFHPASTTPDARVLSFPMAGEAIGPQVQMMHKDGILDRYGDILAEFPAVVKTGGAWTSDSPGSQQYWFQAVNNVLYGRWKKIDTGFGRAVLGYFGKTPLPPDSEVIKLASEQLELPLWEGDPLDAAPKNIELARKALEERSLPVSETNIFLVLVAMEPGKTIDLNEGILFLTGRSKIDIPWKRVEKQDTATAPPPSSYTGPVTTKCTVTENNVSRVFMVTVEPVSTQGAPAAETVAPVSVPTAAPVVEKTGTEVRSTFAGSVELTDILVSIGDTVKMGEIIAKVEAMKAQHDIVAPCDGKVTAIHVNIGDEIDQTKPIMTIS
jgi:pyruvate carboxylase subunit B